MVVGQLVGYLNSAVSNYISLTNKPKINGVELVGDKTIGDIGVEKSISSAITATDIADGDFIPTIDIDDTNKTKKITWANIVSTLRAKMFGTESGILKSNGAGVVSTALVGADYQAATNTLTAEANLADVDTVPFFDASAGGHRRATFANIKSFLKDYFDSIYTSARITLTGYTKPENKAAISGTDSINTAIGKLEAGIEYNNASISELTADVDFNVTNLVTNGDFSNGTTGWSNVNSTITATNNTLSITGSGGNKEAGTSVLTSAKRAGQKIYARLKFRVTNNVCTSLYLQCGSDGVTAKASPTINEWYTRSAVFNETNDGVGLYIVPKQIYPDAATASGKVMEIQYALAIDLTATFGAGNEPTAAEMDELLKLFPNSWFNGTITLTQKQILTWTLNLIRKNTNAIVALGGTIV